MKSIWFDKFKVDLKQWFYEGYTNVPAYIRALFWFCLGIVFLDLVAK